MITAWVLAYREEQPRKFAHKGVHARYGGPVACHSQEKVEAVHCDEARVHERELIEHSGGRDADIYGANKDMESVLEKHRCKELKRGKNNIGVMASSKTQEGRWMEEFVAQGFFTSSPDKARLGHEALGYAVTIYGTSFSFCILIIVCWFVEWRSCELTILAHIFFVIPSLY